MILRLVIVLIFLIVTQVYAEDIYVAQSAAGSDNGTDCANAKSMSWLNTAGSWGAGDGKVSAGDTAHLCGTITTPLTIQGSGTAGNLITILFESGAKFSAAHWNQSGANGDAAIYGDGKSYLVIDGGTNGIIEATANGTALTNQLECHGVKLNDPAASATVRNLTVRNLYVRAPLSADANYICNGIMITASSAIAGLTINNNTTSHSGSGVYIQYRAGSSDVKAYLNTMSHHGIGLVIGSAGTGATLDGLLIYNNDITENNTWDGHVDIHLNCMHVYAVQSSTLLTNVKIYNNYFHSANDITRSTSLAFLEGYFTSPLIYNNLFYQIGAMGGNGNLVLKGADGAAVMNNTFISSSGTAVNANEWTGYDKLSMKNNIIYGHAYGFYDSTVEGGGTAMTVSNYNSFYPNTILFRFGGTSGQNFTAWQAAGFDANGITTDPDLDVSYKPQNTSPVGVKTGGIDLSGTFTTDKDGNTRTTWGMGAYGYGLGGDIYTLTSSIASGSGTLSFAGADPISSGSNSRTYTITPYNGWKGTFSGTCGATGVCSDSGSGTCTYQKTNVTADCTVVVTFTEQYVL